MKNASKTVLNIGDFVNFQYLDVKTGLLNLKAGVVVKSAVNVNGDQYVTVKRPSAGVASYSQKHMRNLVKF